MDSLILDNRSEDIGTGLGRQEFMLIKTSMVVSSGSKEQGAFKK